jgi:hypothetical protein
VRLHGTLWVAAMWLLATTAHAQLLRVYAYEQPAAGMPELSLWDSYVPKSGAQYTFFGHERSRDGLFVHALEVELGVTPNFALGAYADAEQPDGAAFTYTQTRLLARYAIARKRDLPIDIGIYAEYYMPRPDYQPEHLELRVILEKDLGDFTLRANPIFDKVTSGEHIEAIEFEYAAGVYYRRFLLLQPGVEAFGSTGELQDPHRARNQTHQVFAVIDLRFFGGWLHWHIGAGYGYTHAADDFTIKSILSYEPAPSFPLTPPSSR